MAESLNDLYLKIANEVEPALEEDRYFQYMFELIQSGETTIDQKHQIMHKVVDEEWLEVTENTIDSIYKIINAPRKFIKRSEENAQVDGERLANVIVRDVRYDPVLYPNRLDVYLEVVTTYGKRAVVCINNKTDE